MDLYLQFGYGMMEHCRHLIGEWGGGTVVLSPRDLTNDQLSRLAATINGLENGHVLLDPQFYLPHSDHERLCSHGFWPDEYDTNVFWQGPALNSLLTKLQALNVSLCTESFILPGLLARNIEDSWLEVQRAINAEAQSMYPELPLIQTIALSDEAIRDQNQIGNLIEAAAGWKVDGFYVVCEHPRGAYLVDDPNWLANVLDLCAGLRLLGKRVILGYCNHQMLSAATSKVNAICSGTWMNVRSFPPDKFRTAYDDEIRQRATWYYAPQALSEYKIPFLDIALRQGVINLMAPPAGMTNYYSDILFSGAQPTSVGFDEPSAFRHYLTCLRQQAFESEQTGFEETAAYHNALMNEAETLARTLSVAGISGQLREFTNYFDVNRAAIAVLRGTRGPIMERMWTRI